MEPLASCTVLHRDGNLVNMRQISRDFDKTFLLIFTKFEFLVGGLDLSDFQNSRVR